jgi:hypothetical protein
MAKALARAQHIIFRLQLGEEEQLGVLTDMHLALKNVVFLFF